MTEPPASELCHYGPSQPAMPTVVTSNAPAALAGDVKQHLSISYSLYCTHALQIEASIEELAQEGMEARLAAAQSSRDERQTACGEAAAAVEAAERELAGAQAGDGRDESNKTLQERLADAQNAQASSSHYAC